MATRQTALRARGWDVRPYMLCAFSHAFYVWNTARYNTSVFLHTLVAFCILHGCSFHFSFHFPPPLQGVMMHSHCIWSATCLKTVLILLPPSSASETTTLTPPHVLQGYVLFNFPYSEHPCTLPLEYSVYSWGSGSHFVDIKFTTHLLDDVRLHIY